MAEYAIRVSGLAKRFNSVEALSDLNFEVPHGQVFALLGRNGAGKTTAVRILTTNIRPDAGRAEILGLDVVGRPGAVRSRIGLAGQFAAVDGNLTGRENLRLMARLTRVPRRRIPGVVDDLLDRFGLGEPADRPAKTYSGGMRRRLDIAAALVHRPQVLFLDEPSTGLDLESRLALWEMVRELVREGTTMLLTTQYLEEADSLADRIAILDAGRIVADGSPQTLKSRTGAAVVEVGFADEAAARTAAEGLSRVEGLVVQHEGTVLTVPASDGPQVTMTVAGVLSDHRLVPTTLALREPSLDDAFLAITTTSTGRPS